jgi:transglutaminase-like putative cysteine protease
VKVSGKSSFGQGAGTVLKVSYTAGGVPLPKRTVNLNINGETYTRTTDNNGIASVIPIDFDIGRYAVNYETDDESKFHGTSGSFDINVFKRSPSKITWKSGSSFKDKSQTFKVLATGADGNRASGGSVELTIDGETYYAAVSSNGYATVKTSVAIGKYKVAFAFEGNNEYLSSDYNHKTINVKLSKFGKGLNQKNAVGLKAYLKSSSHCKVGTKKIKALVKSLTKGLTSKVDKAKAIFNYVRDTLDYSYYYDTKYGASGTLKHKTGNCVDHSHLLVSMFRTAGLHARYVHGKCHFKSGGTTGHVWTQVKIGKTWVCADAVSYRNSLGKINNWYTKSYTVHNTYSSLPF